MVSIIPRVDLLGNTVVDWICKLSYFRLDTLTVTTLDTTIDNSVQYIVTTANYIQIIILHLVRIHSAYCS